MYKTRFDNLKRALGTTKLDIIDENLEIILNDDIQLENIYPNHQEEVIDTVDKKDIHINNSAIKKDFKNTKLNSFLKKKINF